MNEDQQFFWTRKQAILMGLREVCARDGHNLQAYFAHLRRADGNAVDPEAFRCTRCDVQVTLTYPPMPGDDS